MLIYNIVMSDKNLYYGAYNVPKDKKRATMKEAIEANQIRYYGVKKIDQRTIEKSREKQKNQETIRDLQNKKIRLMAKIKRMIKEIKAEKDINKKDKMKDEVRALAKEHDQYVNNINRLMKKEERPKQQVKTVKQDKPNLLKQMEKIIKKAKEEDKKQDQIVKSGEDIIKKMNTLRQQKKSSKDDIKKLLKIEIWEKDEETKCKLKMVMFKLLENMDINIFSHSELYKVLYFLGFSTFGRPFSQDKLKKKLEEKINSWKKKGYKEITECRLLKLDRRERNERIQRMIDRSKEQDKQQDQIVKRGEKVIKKMNTLRQQDTPKRTIDDLLKIKLHLKDEESRCELKKEMLKLLENIDINKFTKDKIDSLNSWLGYDSWDLSLKKDKLKQLEYPINSWKKEGYKSIYDCVRKERMAKYNRRVRNETIQRKIDQSKEKDKKQDQIVKRGENVIKNMKNLKKLNQRLNKLKKAKQKIEERISELEKEYKSLL